MTNKKRNQGILILMGLLVASMSNSEIVIDYDGSSLKMEHGSKVTIRSQESIYN